MLNTTKVELGLIADPDMYIFFEKGARGGVSYICNSQQSYDPNQKSKHIMYLDANNLYGYAMLGFFPTDGWKWIDPKDSGLNK